MNTLRLEIINLHAPYKVLQDPERHNNFYFVSDSGARFDIDFTVTRQFHFCLIHLKSPHNFIFKVI